MAMQENRPNIVVDENFLMLEKRLKRRYAERASVYSNADAIEQERNGARAYAIAPEAYSDPKAIGGMSMYKSGNAGGVKYMTTEDYVAYFSQCRDTFGAMNVSNVAPAEKKIADTPRVCVNTKKMDQIKKLKAKEDAKKKRVAPATSVKSAPVTSARSAPSAKMARPVALNVPQQKSSVKIESGKLDAFFEKLATARIRAVASVAAIALCCTAALGGVMAFAADDNSTAGGAGPMENMRVVEPVEQSDEEAHANLLSTLE